VVIALYSRYEQNTTKMPHKFNVLTQNIHTLCLSVEGHTHGRTDGCTENIYSIFRDKLLLLGEHVYEGAFLAMGLLPDNTSWLHCKI
jgi:hypothetical protein